MAVYNKIIDRDGSAYKRKHYRAHWQPLWAFLGLLLCSLLMLFSGWAAVYDLAVESPGVTRRGSIVNLVAAYIGVRTLALRFYIWNADRNLACHVLWCIWMLQVEVRNKDARCRGA